MTYLTNIPLFTWILGEYQIELCRRYDELAEIFIKNIKAPNFIFKIETSFQFESRYWQDYFYLKELSLQNMLHSNFTFEAVKKEGLIIITNNESGLRICRIPISFICEMIADCMENMREPKPYQAEIIEWYYCVEISGGSMPKVVPGINFKGRYLEGAIGGKECVGKEFTSRETRATGNYRPDDNFASRAFGRWVTLLDYNVAPTYEFSIAKANM